VAPYLVPLEMSYFNQSDIIWDQEAFGGVYRLSNGSTEVIGVAIQTWVELLVYNATLFNNATFSRSSTASTTSASTRGRGRTGPP